MLLCDEMLTSVQASGGDALKQEENVSFQENFGEGVVAVSGTLRGGPGLVIHQSQCGPDTSSQPPQGSTWGLLLESPRHTSRDSTPSHHAQILPPLTQLGQTKNQEQEVG